jgi:cellulose synthase/poly-beta-1,6-N-acetylglucosamine synthase-like glycosyltransferase
MTTSILIAGLLCVAATALHLISIVIVARRLRRARSVIDAPRLGERAPNYFSARAYPRSDRGWQSIRRGTCGQTSNAGAHCNGSGAQSAAGVSLVRPVCGIDNYVEDTLHSAFHLDYSRYEIIFCVAFAADPVVPLVRRLIAEHPHVAAQLLIGNESISDNPKPNNVYKGWRAAAHDWVVMAESNVLMPRDYIERLLAAWRHDTGLVASPPIGCCPDGFWAELECAFLNGYQARWH